MRLLVPNVVPREVIAPLVEALRGAEFVDGRVSAEGAARSVKHVLQLPRGSAIGESGGDAIQRALLASPEFVAAVEPLRVVRPQLMRYDAGMGYGPHHDAPIFPEWPRVRADVAVTVFLNDPDEYSGGDLVVDTPEGRVSCRGPAGSALVYSAGQRHSVERVTRGSRFVAVTWVQSLLRSAEQRALLHRLGRTTARIEQNGGTPEDVEALREIHAALLRGWAET
ncbi:MAG TPA: Fe2+-dependent dioxygenase [Polyangiaceae bacterium]|nr:Fe2+-dependent dioxygenase [Polyangiaceae bacterium]